MRTFSVSAFKAHALGILAGVGETGEKILVTKRGKPLAVVEAYADPDMRVRPGRLEGSITFEKDLTAPLAEPDGGGGAS